MLHRLERTHIEALVNRLAGGKSLPAELLRHIVTKTDGVPLYVEELTKMLLESDLLLEETEQYVLTGRLSDSAIPATLQDSLMARLDRFPKVKEVAQLGAVLGREFTYEMLQALTAVEGSALQEGLGQLVETELLYQRGRIPQAKYIFRHALIRDAAYQSLLRRTWQQYHQQVAQLLEARFPKVVETQPELVAYHYSEAGEVEIAISYWHQAGEVAHRRSANPEASNHLSRGVELLATLPATPKRAQQELDLQMALGPILLGTKGSGHPEVEHAYARARELCQQVGESSQLFPVLWGLLRYYRAQGQLHMARELGEELLVLAQHQDDPILLVTAHQVLGSVLWFLGNFLEARVQFEQGFGYYNPQQHNSYVVQNGQDQGVLSLYFASWTLWYLGYPDQGMWRSQEALALAQELAHPPTQIQALNGEAILRLYRRDIDEAHKAAETAIALCNGQGEVHTLANVTCISGWALAEQGKQVEGTEQMKQGLRAMQAAGNQNSRPVYLILLADIYGKQGRVDEGLLLLTEAWELVNKMGQGVFTTELHRIEGELRLRQIAPNISQVEACFQRALDFARNQQASSLELRAATSLSRLWQQQGKHREAYDLLVPVYEWFMEGLDTADLRDAKVLLGELSEAKMPPTRVGPTSD